MKKIKVIIASVAMLSMLTPLTAMADSIYDPRDFTGKVKESVVNESITVKPGTNSNPKTPPKDNTSETGGETEKIPSYAQGTKDNPFPLFVNTPYSDAKLKSEVSTLMKNATANNTSSGTLVAPIQPVTTTRYSNDVPDYIKTPFTPFFIRSYRSSITTYAKNVQTKKTTAKDDHYVWSLSGPVSWEKNSDSASMTITFTQPGKYKLVFLPYEELTNTVSETVTGYGYEVWPAGSGKSRKTLFTTSTSTGPTTSTEVLADAGRRQVWVLEITAADINTPIKIGTPTSGGPGPSGNSRVEVLDDIDVTIVE